MLNQRYLKLIYRSYYTSTNKKVQAVFCLFFVIFSCTYSLFLFASNEISFTRSRLIQLALHLEAADPELKYEFSRIALSEMYDAYQSELTKSYTNLPRDPKKREKVRRWGYATHSYLKSLDHVFFQLDSGKVLDFYVSRQSKIILMIEDEQPVIISGPNNGANKQIEQNIVEQFCLLYECREYFASTQLPESKVSIDQFSMGQESYSSELYSSVQGIINKNIRGAWSFNSNKQVDFVTSNNIIFRFTSIKNRSAKQNWALDIAKEINLLLNSLVKAKMKGFKIHWSSLKIEVLPVTDNAYKVTINRQGEFIKLPLPMLGDMVGDMAGDSQLIVIQLVPWMQNYIDNNSVSKVIINGPEQFIKY